ncbi:MULTISPECIES: DUF3742 family protein [unclassified Pseudomonas]|uniref:DUF3742 family protein n=1 Tax=unclassified Pseudomonas TaxID=196821 RepID=UPI000B86C564|nr:MULTISPECIES: DUF3742 family protein [unclassified Pseudomonas]
MELPFDPFAQQGAPRAKEMLMSEQEQSSGAEKFGNYLGRCWKGYSRILDRFSRCLQRAGVPFVLCRMIGVSLQAVVLVALLCVAFWITIIGMFVLLGASGLFSPRGTDDLNADWKNGPSGFGIYDQSGVRIDPHDPDDVS